MLEPNEQHPLPAPLPLSLDDLEPLPQPEPLPAPLPLNLADPPRIPSGFEDGKQSMRNVE